MAKEDLSIDIELAGYKGRITHIWASAATPLLKTRDSLLVNVEFAEPHPAGSILSMAISISADSAIATLSIHSEGKQRDVLLALVKREGDKQVAETVARHLKERAEAEEQRKHKGIIDNLAGEVTNVLKGA